MNSQEIRFFARSHETRSTCPYCGVGCGVIIEHDGRRISGVRGDPDHPANFGRLCTKGSTLHLTAAPETLSARALYPEMRLRRNDARSRVSWDEALERCADRFAEVIKEHGPDSVAFYISGQLLTEDYYVFNKLAKGLVGTNNVDTNSRLCMSSAVSGYKQTLGADAPPCSYADLAFADCLLIAGSNTAWAHPIVFRRIEDARKANPAQKLIVIDPRRTDTAEAADLHLAIQPGTDIALFNAMLHVMLWEGLCDQAFIREHTQGFEALKKTLSAYAPAAVASLCGVKADDIVKAARWFGESPRALSLYCQGLNQSVHGTHNNVALIHLHLATGKIGKPGCGPFSLTGQPNAMGGREVGGMATLLSAHRDLANSEDRAEVARLWGVDTVPEKPGLAAVALFDAVKAGKVKALWIACTNPAQSMPDLGSVRKALQQCEFVVVQEAYRGTDTVCYADVLLPASTWGEKDGTVTNSERRISRARGAVATPGEARHDWVIAQQFAHKLAARLGKTELARRMFAWDGAEAVFAEHCESTRGRDLDITGLSYKVLDELGPQQWPFPEGAISGRERLYEDSIFATPDGRARFVDLGYVPTFEATSARYPLHLNTGRLRDQWHGMSRTGTVARLFAHAPEPVVQLNPDDLARRGIADGALVSVTSKRGRIVAKAQASVTVAPAQAFMPMHWGSQFMRDAGVNVLMPAAVDPYSQQPELKHAAVNIEVFESAWQLVALRRARRDGTPDIEALRAILAPCLAQFDYATLTLAGRDAPVLVLRAWGGVATPLPEASLLATISAALDLDQPHALSFSDGRRGITKRALIEDEMLTGALLCGETRAVEWLVDWMARGESPQEVRKWLLAPLAAPPRGGVLRGKVICNCFDVAEDEILTSCREGLDLDGVQARHKCGTSCGSCLPEVKRLVQSGAR